MSLFSRLRLAESKPRPTTAEIGDSGVGFSQGAGQPRRLRETEYLFELRGTQAHRTYDRMRFSDPKIAGLRAAQNLPLLRAAWSCEPCDPDDKDAVKKAEFVEEALFKQFPWRSFISDSMLSLDFGFAPFEIIWKKRDDGSIVVDRLAFRPPASIWPQDIFIDKGSISHVIQRPVTGGVYDMPGEKLVWFCNSKEGDDFRGRPLLRAMYKPWKLKEELEVELAVLIGKMGGVPDIKTLGVVSDEVAADLDAAGASFGIAEGGYLRHTDDVEVALLASNAKVAEVLEAIRYFDTQLSDVCMAQILDLGVNQAGSRALGTTLSDMFGDAIQAMASYREDVLNCSGGLVNQLIAYNFSSDDNLPLIKAGNVQRVDMKAMAAAFAALATAGMPFGNEVWEWVRSEMNLPEGDPDAQAVAPPKKPNPFEKTPPDAEPTAPGADSADGAPTDTPHEQGAQASETAAAAGFSLAERSPRGVELFLNLAELTGRFDDAKTAIRTATQATRDALAKELARRATAAAAKGKLAAFAAGAPPMVDKLTQQVRAVLADFYAAGKQQVSDELARQQAGTPWTPKTVGNRIKAAEKTPKPAPAPDSTEAIAAQAETTARLIASRAQAAAAAAASRSVSGVPVDEAAVETATARESDAAALRCSGVVSDLMSLGRTDQMALQAQDIADYVYSALLDGATCSECEAMDGDETTDADTAAGWAPNPSCEGGDFCRCLVIAEISQKAGEPNEG